MKFLATMAIMAMALIFSVSGSVSAAPTTPSGDVVISSTMNNDVQLTRSNRHNHSGFSFNFGSPYRYGYGYGYSPYRYSYSPYSSWGYSTPYRYYGWNTPYTYYYSW